MISVDASTDKFVFERDSVETADVDRVEEEVESVPPRARTRPITLVATAPLRRPTPWLKIALIAVGLCAAAAGWLVHGEELAQEPLRSQELERQLAARQGEHDAPAQERARLEQQLAAHQNDQRLQAALARKRTRDQAIEQQLAGRRDQEALVWEERARTKELEHQLAVRHVETEALAKERARSKILEQRLADKERAYSQELEQQLAARQGDQEALAQERARSLAFERELVKQRYTWAIPLPAFELIPTWTALALDSISPAPPPPAAREAMPAAPTDKPVVDKAPIDKSTGDKPVIVQPPQAPGNAEATRLMVRAKLLLEQGDVGAARSVLERAAETGSAQALFSLAETYDPAVLSAWGTVSTQGDAAKSQKLYADALAGGFLPAKDRLRASR
jgi:hypothetical protein